VKQVKRAAAAETKASLTDIEVGGGAGVVKQEVWIRRTW
jgi:hypothetical protein